MSFAFNWRQSAAHWLLLKTFFELRPATDHPPLPAGGSWSVHLKEDPEKAIKRFLAQGLLVEAIVPELLGSYVYDLLTQLDEPAARKLKQSRPQIGRTKTTWVTPRLKIEWCYVPAGYFLLGSSSRDAAARDNEKPQRRLYLPAYYIAQYPITNRQYQLFVQATGRQMPRHWRDNGGRIPGGKEDHPVTRVSWGDAVAFCQWAAARAGVGIRLPTEAEWEKAARGRDGRIYPWGNRWREGVCNANDAVKDTTPVGRYRRGVSPYGVHDMIGNVWEATSSLHQPYPYRPDDGREDLTASGNRVWRGGAYWSNPDWARAAYRNDHNANNANWNNNGFRVGWSAHFFPERLRQKCHPATAWWPRLQNSSGSARESAICSWPRRVIRPGI